MQDRPTYHELLAALERFLEDELLPALEGAARFNTRVAANTLRIIRRELEHEDEQLAAERAGLDELLGPAEPPAARAALHEALHQRNEQLCQRIRSGDVDANPFRAAVLSHVRRTVRDKLLVTNPAWLGEHQS